MTPAELQTIHRYVIETPILEEVSAGGEIFDGENPEGTPFSRQPR
jgi:hypothetical protein